MHWVLTAALQERQGRFSEPWFIDQEAVALPSRSHHEAGEVLGLNKDPRPGSVFPEAPLLFLPQLGDRYQGPSCPAL